MAELHANMTFDPAKINLQQSQHQCEHGGRKSVCVKTKVCFAYSVKSDQQDQESAASEPASFLHSFIHSFIVVVIYYSLFSYPLRPAEIRYNLTLDALRAKARASFIDQEDKSDRRIIRTFTIKDRWSSCVQETFMMSASTLVFEVRMINPPLFNPQYAAFCDSQSWYIQTLLEV